MILCCGEALIDMIPEQTVSGNAGFVPHCGGSVFNTAIALGRLGAPAGLLAGLSSDQFGQQLGVALVESRVDTGYVITTDRLTTLAVVHLTGGQARYTFYDENSAGRGIEAQDMPVLPETVDCLFLGGISLCNLPAADSFVALAERMRGRTALMVDPNVRPGFAEDAAAYRARLERLLALADIVKVSDEDLDWLFPDAGTLEQKRAAMHGLGPALVIVTRGGQGVTAALANGPEVSVPAHPAQVVDTVGAGDTFNAGFLARACELGLFAQGGLKPPGAVELASCLDLGAQAAAVTVSRAGANPPWREELAG